MKKGKRFKYAAIIFSRRYLNGPLKGQRIRMEIAVEENVQGKWIKINQEEFKTLKKRL